MKTKIGFVENMEIGDVDVNDFPDFCDAFIESADVDGCEATEQECEWLQDNYPETVNELAYMSLIN